ncbi:bifunctional diaminohydroxyphosphoribosylaminopyrimidine deaminase/5-amino-6-(5-phosphoribosylamino)uracil reductase RibD [Marinococcus halophilus]|uniref:Riboflavin biosynthesis protein RibD n=1 Tax=Marinococcus halophilus TaxID=1371 RepID=A0A510Y3P9_MARHA|nr:bifunctional diaminohydroxyphosphoribosylaminopyrimidine deaminase/5-amino-6-(5-phosphoribosylamino)uracil reductase RibD [Marinococcus halophilus]GEK57949.1 riboflavin biosynthesis protein RibD [Marinococcus halophilus]
MDHTWMHTALELARSTEGQTYPNPMVGAVVVKEGRIVGMGAHLRSGEAHAEVHALDMAGNKTEGATIYVTLEPCSHYGRTPPCAKQIIEAGIARVVVAATDPNPLVAGNGIQMMKDAGLEVVTGVKQEEAAYLNRKFFHFIESGRPYVTAKTASSLDGKTATATGESQWITGEEAREDVHKERRRCDGILVGIGTVLSDDPSLTARVPETGVTPTRVVLDSTLRMPENSRMLKDGAAPVYILTNEPADTEKTRRLEEAGAEVIPVASGVKNISAVLDVLGETKIVSLFVEGGAGVLGSFLEAEMIQEYLMYVAPMVIGGENAPGVYQGSGISTLQEARAFSLIKEETFGQDRKYTLQAGE